MLRHKYCDSDSWSTSLASESVGTSDPLLGNDAIYQFDRFIPLVLRGLTLLMDGFDGSLSTLRNQSHYVYRFRQFSFTY